MEESMFENIVKMGLVVTLFLVLVGGAVYILVRPADARAGLASRDRSGWSAGRYGESETPIRDTWGSRVGRGGGQGRGDDGQGGDRALATGGHGGGVQATTGQRGQSVSGTGRGQGTQANSLWSEATPPAWQTVEGTVVESGSELLVDTADGEILVGLGQEFYREEEGFSVEVGDTVSVEGFYEDGEFKAGTVENVTRDAVIVLRDATGRPMWSGRGNRQNQS
jgi:hypothetical protein